VSAIGRLFCPELMHLPAAPVQSRQRRRCEKSAETMKKGLNFFSVADTAEVEEIASNALALHIFWAKALFGRYLGTTLAKSSCGLNNAAKSKTVERP
jgi:hypothetical protein